jgi:tetratricopeptide (TPR) repeat protein
VADGYHLWSEKYDRELDDVFAIQDEISLAIVDKLKLKLTPRQEARLVGKQTANSAAHEAYLKGRYFWNQRGPGLKKAVEHFELALAEDDNYASAYAGLADSYALMGFYGYLPPREVMPKAKEAALRALQIDDNLAEAHCSLGYIHTIFDWEWEKAKKEFQRAFELNPNYGPARYWYSVWLWFMGFFEEAVAQVRRGLETDPLSVYMHVQLGLVLLAAQRYGEASDQLHQALELDPNFMPAQSMLGVVYYFQSRVKDGIRELQKAIDTSERDQFPVGLIGCVYAATGNRKRAEEILMELEGRAQNEYIDAQWIAGIYALLDEKDEAFEWLEKAYDERAPRIGFCALNVYPGWMFNNLRSDPRFEDLLLRLGLKPGRVNP